MATIITAVSFHNFLHIPPVYGMMLGLGYLKRSNYVLISEEPARQSDFSNKDFDVFDKIARAEWDTLFFFDSVILCVGGLSFIGHLNNVSTFFYGELGPTTANVLVGMPSAIVDNIPVMFAVLITNPEMFNHIRS